MDPKAAPTLDPKLKEAYDRVMGATVPKTPPQMPSVDLPTPPKEPEKPFPQPVTPTPIATSNVVGANAAQGVNPSTPVAPIHTVVHPSSGFVAPHEEKKSPVSGTLLVIAGVVFLLVYTLFWLKWFGIALPFLP